MSMLLVLPAIVIGNGGNYYYVLPYSFCGGSYARHIEHEHVYFFNSSLARRRIFSLHIFFAVLFSVFHFSDSHINESDKRIGGVEASVLLSQVLSNDGGVEINPGTL